ncbi:MAG TPA: hypothetical protein VJ810_26560 [Blastocatellia bacterium]|nr:hypothetical protein [Blastocatellia bacterium]
MVVESLSPHSLTYLTSNRRAIFSLCLFILCLLAAAPVAFAQREYTVIKPRERSTNETVAITRKASQPTKGVLQVVLDPVISGKVVITDVKGRVLDSADAGEDGQATFELKRGQSYVVKASSPGFVGAERKSPVLKAATSVRLQLKGQFAKLELPGLPKGAQVLIDGVPRATADKSVVVLDNLEPGRHTLLVQHPEYNDYQAILNDLEAGIGYLYPMSTILTKVAKLTVLGLPDTRILIDGEVQGVINPDGVVRIDYELEKASEHTISAQLLGYQTWSQRVTLSPGTRSITVELDPIPTSAGVTDFFDNLSLWNAPATWKITSDARKKRLEVRGEQLGTLRDKTYRDFVISFKLWLNDGKGATWAIRVDKEGRNYYLFHLAGPKSTIFTPKRLYTYLVKDGAMTEVSTPFPVLVDLNQTSSYNIEILVKDHEIKQLITDDQSGDVNDLGAWTDTTPAKEKFLYGSFGFRAFSDEVFTVDDLTITLDLKQFKGK